LRTIAGIIQPRQGQSVTVNGTFAPILAIGAGLELELTGYENIAALGLIWHPPQKHNAVQNIKDFSELSDEVLSMPVKQYSSGMVARLAFSISLANDSDILIIDEVLAVGDQGFQAKCLEKIYQIKDQGKTILFVSHFPDDVARICNKAILEGGEMTHSGNSEEVCENYRRLF
jgi:ABC-type polysaccharide/polyol phosphate transport system ATPase subunit